MSAHRPNLVVTSSNTFWNSKEAVECNVALGEFFDLHETYGEKVEIGAALYNEPFTDKLARSAKNMVKPVAAVTAGVGLLAAAAVAGGLLAVPVAVGALGAVTGGFSLSWLASGVSKAFAKNETGLPTGLSIQHTSSEGLQFSNLQDSSTPAEGLREMTMANMKRYPSALHVVHLNGHGHGAKAVAGLPGKQEKEALMSAVGQAQRKIDVAFYETCLGANFEFLHGQAEVADYAVAFEDLIPKSNTKSGRLPLKEILAKAVEASDSKTAALEMAKRAGQHFDRDKEPSISRIPLAERNDPANRDAIWRNSDSTAVAVDLGTLRSQLSPSLDVAGRALSRELQQDKDFGEVVRQARENNSVEGSHDLVDLGGFLREVQKGAGESNTTLQRAIDEGLESLDASLLHKRTGKHIPLSGLSFHANPNRVSFSNPVSKAHADSSLPRGWVEFVDAAFS